QPEHHKHTSQQQEHGEQASNQCMATVFHQTTPSNSVPSIARRPRSPRKNVWMKGCSKRNTSGTEAQTMTFFSARTATRSDRAKSVSRSWVTMTTVNPS